MGVRRWTREATIEVIHQWVLEGGDLRIAAYREWKRGREAPTDTTIARLFGSWRELIWQAGYDPVNRPGPNPVRRHRRS